jgi:DNA-binding MarR family transcriptional regulator
MLAYWCQMPKHADQLVPLIIADVYQLAGQLRRNAEALSQRVGQSQVRWQLLSAASAGRHSVPQLARRLGAARQNVQRVADLLVGEGLAIFEANPDHKRSPQLVLTDSGRATLRELTKNARSYYRALANEFSDQELTTLWATLRTLHDALQRLENHHVPRSHRS